MVKKPTAAGDAEAYERRRLRSLAFSSGLLQRGDPAAPRSSLAPSSTVTRLQGRDIVRRGGQRKSRFLFSFPGLLAPAAAAASGGRVGELADLGSKNPLLYLEFPQGRMKLFGTHVYPKNKYLTLQMTRSAKGVACEDVFESLIVFSEAWWIGTKEVNPEELKLEFPKEFQNDGAVADCDFKGGAGSTSDEAIGGNRPGKEIAEPLSPKFESDGHASEDSDHMDENGTQTTSETPSVRQSARTSGKKALNYTELSSGGDSADSDNEIEVPEDLDEKMNSPEVKKESQSEDIKLADPSQSEDIKLADPSVRSLSNNAVPSDPNWAEPTNSTESRLDAPPPSPLFMDAADGEKPSPAAAESRSRQQDSQWLATLSEPELDLLISLKDLAATRAKNAGHPRLADRFDLRTLRALGIVLLQNFKERLKETSVDPNILDRLALLSDSGADFTNSGSDSEVVRPNEDQQTPIGVERIRKEMQDGDKGKGPMGRQD